MKSPALSIAAGEAAIRSVAREAQTLEEGAAIHLRIKELPADPQSGILIGIRDIRSKHMGQFISVEGLVRRANEVRPRVSMAAFKCLRCGHVTMIPQEEAMLREPLECEKLEGGGGGCGKLAGQTKFKLVKSISTFIDTETIEIQEQPEGLKAGAQPQTLVAHMEDDIAGQIYPGARIVINGILDSRMRQRGAQGQTTFDIFLNVNSMEFKDPDEFSITVSEDEQRQIDELAADPNIIERIRDSISPTIFGLEYEKEALALQLFGGIPKRMPDGTRIRGDIHILLVGDPGTAKSQLLRYMSDLTPRGMYASGKSATGAGLTAAAVKDDFGDGRWTLEAGALVLADKGLACVDELDKMSKEDRSAMHEAMEQQTISIAKAGINATLQSRCSVLGAANPKFGRFTQEGDIPLAQQIDLPPTLLSRFDLIFPIYDIPNSAEDAKIAEHILNSHYVGEMRERYEAQDDTGEGYDAKEYERSDRSRKPAIDPELLRKYVYTAKKRHFPVLTQEAMSRMKDYYLDVRRLSERREAKSVPITARQLEGFVRVAEASAKARMSEKVTIEDAERAIKIVKEFLTRVIGHGRDELSWDSESLYTGVSHSQHQSQLNRRMSVNAIIKDLISQDSQGFTFDEVMGVAGDQGITGPQAKAILEDMRKGGEIYEAGMKSGKAAFKMVQEL